MTSLAQPDWHEHFLNLHDHIINDGRAWGYLMLAPMKDGSPAFAEVDDTSQLEDAPDRELSPEEEARLCIVAADIDAVSDAISVLIWRDGGSLWLRSIPASAKPGDECELAHRIVAHIVGATVPAQPVAPVMPAWLASAPKPGALVAANDNIPIDPWAEQKSPTMPHGLLPQVVEAFARTQAEIMGVDPGGLAVACLAVAAAAIPDKIELQVKRHDTGWKESARLWVALVGSPSAKKSPTISAAAHPLRAIDRELFGRQRAARQAYDSLDKAAKLTTRPPVRERLSLEDTTIEAAGEILKDSPNGVLLFQDELSGWFGGMDKYAGGKGGAAKDRAFWLQAFNGGSYSVSRINRGDIWIDNLSVSLLGGIQPEPIRKLAAESVDDGLLQRLLPVVLSRATVGKDVPMAAVAHQWDEAVRRLHVMQKPRRGLLDTVLRFSDEAQEIRNDREAMHHELAASWEGVNRKLSSHFGKYDGIYARLCVLWHCLETVADCPNHEINADTAIRVAQFMDKFLKPHAIAFYGNVLGMSDGHDALLATAGWVLSHRPDVVSVRDVQRGDTVMRSLSKDDAITVLERLDAFGWLEPLPVVRRDQQKWVVMPEVYSVFGERAKDEKARRERVRSLIAASLK